MTGTHKRKDGITTKRCSACGKRFDLSGKRGRPPKRCALCEMKREYRANAKANLARAQAGV